MEGSQPTSELQAHRPEHCGHLDLSQLKEAKKRPLRWNSGWKAIPISPNSESTNTSSVMSRNTSTFIASPDPSRGTPASQIIPDWSDTNTRSDPSGWAAMFRYDPFPIFSTHIIGLGTGSPSKHGPEPPNAAQKPLADCHVSDSLGVENGEWETDTCRHSFQTLEQKSVELAEAVELQRTGTLRDSDSILNISAEKGSHFEQSIDFRSEAQEESFTFMALS